MTHALESAELLARYAPARSTRGTRRSRSSRAGGARCSSDYALLTRGLLWLERHPAWIGPALSALAGLARRRSRIWSGWPAALARYCGARAAGDAGTAPAFARKIVSHGIHVAIVALMRRAG